MSNSKYDVPRIGSYRLIKYLHHQQLLNIN